MISTKYYLALFLTFLILLGLQELARKAFAGNECRKKSAHLWTVRLISFTFEI
jgi:hypothetical protein